jgi:hypothetical protein
LFGASLKRILKYPEWGKVRKEKTPNLRQKHIPVQNTPTRERKREPEPQATRRHHSLGRLE